MYYGNLFFKLKLNRSLKKASDITTAGVVLAVVELFVCYKTNSLLKCNNKIYFIQ